MGVVTRGISSGRGARFRWRSNALLLAGGVLLGACASTAPPAATPGSSSSTSGEQAMTSGSGILPAATSNDSTASSSTEAAASRFLPDRRFTPGALDPEVTQSDIGDTICRSGWTRTVRPPESYTETVKRLEADAGGSVRYQGTTYSVHGFEPADAVLSHYELDHLVPLELGGSPADPANLWLEPHEAPAGGAPAGFGSETKDRVEYAARQAVCRGQMSLGEARSAMAADWRELGRRLGTITGP
jgi:hypothetical protein